MKRKWYRIQSHHNHDRNEEDEQGKSRQACDYDYQISLRANSINVAVERKQERKGNSELSDQAGKATKAKYETKKK